MNHTSGVLKNGFTIFDPIDLNDLLMSILKKKQSRFSKSRPDNPIRADLKNGSMDCRKCEMRRIIKILNHNLRQTEFDRIEPERTPWWVKSVIGMPCKLLLKVSIFPQLYKICIRYNCEYHSFWTML